jgi:nitroreductase
LIKALIETQYREFSELLVLDPIDLEDLSEVLATRLRAPSHGTDDLYQWELTERCDQNP